MPPRLGTRDAAAAAVALACRLAGRERVVRAARFALNRARLDLPNHMSCNGEAVLQRAALRLDPPGRDFVAFDVGANIGEWSRSLVEAAGEAGRLDDVVLHAFEPSSYTFGRLQEAALPQHTVLNQVALSDRVGAAKLHIVHPGAGTNSLHRRPEPGAAEPAPRTSEGIVVTTLDAYCSGRAIETIHLLKIDTEGHDLTVLHGARSMLAERRILLTQFEYNHRWVQDRHFLKDAFDFLLPLGYRIGKVTPAGVECYEAWDHELESFVEGNYVACDATALTKIPQVRWWKSPY